MTFDFDKALAAFKDDPAVREWMNLNREQLVALTEQQILSLVATYVVGGDAAAAIAPALDLKAQAERLVENTSDMARRQYEAGQRLLSVGKIGLQLLISVLAAGVGL